tara:strand:- start:68976 stop:69638 length:663 start_codon:yes stop_codon:yes gene_type:complete
MTLDNQDFIRLLTQEKGLIYIRDALAFYLMDIRIKNNAYNMVIISLATFTAFIESLNAEFGWSADCKDKDNSASSKLASVFPIVTATMIAFLSTMMKFKRIVYKMEEINKSIEKCHYAINRQRETLEDGRKENMGSANGCFREALQDSEKIWLLLLDPGSKRKYLKKSDRIHELFSKDNSEMDEEIIKTIAHSFKPHKPIGFLCILHHWYHKVFKAKVVR